MSDTKETETRCKVREGYGRIAEKGFLTVNGEETAGGCCCGTSQVNIEKLAAEIGYSADDLESLPEGANMGLSCGNPTALASLQAGETVLDLGCGGGFDAFVAGPRVGSEGKIIGVDMTPEMIAKARKNTEIYTERTGLSNVEFLEGEIEDIPVEDGTVDVVISNCVINLSPDKPQVWKEISRVLKPGGRVAVSDLVLLKPLPETVTEMLEALIGCVAGASLVSDVEKAANEAGLDKIEIEPKAIYIDTLVAFDDPLYRKISEALPEGAALKDYIVSAEISAVKPVPQRGSCCGFCS